MAPGLRAVLQALLSENKALSQIDRADAEVAIFPAKQKRLGDIPRAPHCLPHSTSKRNGDQQIEAGSEFLIA